jgi:hypothetical protein
MPWHTNKTDQAVFLTFGVLKAQECITPKIDLQTTIGILSHYYQADFAT